MKICLVVFYNHNYEKNIDKIKNIYKDRFSNLFQIIPFYKGNDKSVINVYESAYQFEGHIAQAKDKIYDPEFSHYVFVSDDVFLNPKLNENNIISELKLNNDSGFITNTSMYTSNMLVNFCYGLESIVYLNGRITNNIEYKNHIPSIEEARRIFDKHGIDWRQGITYKVLNVIRQFMKIDHNNYYKHSLLDNKDICNKILDRIKKYPINTRNLIYPTVYSWADIFVIPRNAFMDFCHYCGVFSAINIFAECAIGTCMVLSCNKIVRIKDTRWKYENGNGKDSWKRREFLKKKYKNSVENLTKFFPKDYLHIHPIKLSEWTMD